MMMMNATIRGGTMNLSETAKLRIKEQLGIPVRINYSFLHAEIKDSFVRTNTHFKMKPKSLDDEQIYAKEHKIHSIRGERRTSTFLRYNAKRISNGN